MTRDELLEALLVERFGRPPRRNMPSDRGQMTVAQIRALYEDDDLTAFTRRKTLFDACKDLDIHRFSKYRQPTGVDNVAAGQSVGPSTASRAPSTATIHYPQK